MFHSLVPSSSMVILLFNLSIYNALSSSVSLDAAFHPSFRTKAKTTKRKVASQWYNSRINKFSEGGLIGMRMRTDEELDSDGLFVERFQRRRTQVRNRIEYERAQRPPNPEYDPKQTVTKLLHGLSHPHDPIRHFGVKVLLESSTKEWLRVLTQSAGVTKTMSKASIIDDDLDLISSSLYRAMIRPNQQFQILVGEDEDFLVDFPTDTVQLDEGECWVECRLRGMTTDELLVVLGWTLQKEETEGAWLVHKIDWQDFRESYRPGIGREEWERICG